MCSTFPNIKTFPQSSCLCKETQEWSQIQIWSSERMYLQEFMGAVLFSTTEKAVNSESPKPQAERENGAFTKQNKPEQNKQNTGKM